MYSVSDETRKPIFEGVQGENESRGIEFDITAWVEELGEGAVTATAKRPTDTTPYPVTVERDGNTVTWKPTSTDTAIEGLGAFQLQFTINDVVAKTRVWNTKIAPSLDPAGDPPDPYDNWLADMRQIAADALQSAQDADASADAAAASAASVAGVTSEVENIRVGADGTTYASAGEAVRTQVSNLENSVNHVTPSMTTFVEGGGVDADGNVAVETNPTLHAWIPATSSTGIPTSNQYTNDYCVTDFIPVDSNTSYGINVFASVFTSVQTVSQYKANKEFISVRQYATVLTTDAECAYLRICLNSSVINDELGTGVLVVKKGTAQPTEYEPPTYLPLTIPQSDYAQRSELPSFGNVKLELPDHYDMLVSDAFEIFWKGVVNAVNYEDYFVEVTCDIGRNYKRRMYFYPNATQIGEHTMLVRLYDNERNLLDEASVLLNVMPKPSSPSSEKVLMYVGDSLTMNGYAPDEFHRRLCGTGGTPAGDHLSNITFIGNKTSVAHNVPYVGEGGWTWVSYNASMRTNAFMWITANGHGKTSADQHSVYKDANNTEWKLETIEANRIKIIRVSGTTALPSTGTLTWVSGGSNTDSIVYTASEQAAGNPFYDEDTQSISFANFVSEQGETSLDYIYVLLGWNNSGITETALKNDVRTFLNNVFRDFPNCKVVILGLEIPAQDGLGYNYGQNVGTLSSYQKCMQYVFNLNKWYAEIAEEPAYQNNVSFVNVAGQFDTEYNMQTVQTTVNSRNNTPFTMQSNGVHPAESGYYQIADACYRDFVGKLNA